ncbi:hypothetical protein [Ruminiclostridium cellulolyticum]|uniref:Uncharacterized protein n=1 Tax=Ruminiclostridium cellulolyticum (strain ATCC 35319 / DSM 5812 / JCM 6584 / H10) TaxID=394503 RepID=B8I885_RUMCH|nr:hypothetical protein [Ruminiclostridium cellulolyticum]ACL77185.1 hypothetical protein Ccel_2891 [Ruminiclostridium cellulolyticum H10]
MDKIRIISNSYNKAIEEGFNRYLDEKAAGGKSEIKIDEEALIADIEQKWLATGLPELDETTPAEFINSLTSLDELMDFFVCMASVSDVGVPGILIERFKLYGGKAASARLLDFAERSLSTGVKDNDDIKSAVSQAVYTIGCLKEDEYKQKLIALLIETDYDDMLLEAICYAIIVYGVSILQEVIDAFNTTDKQTVKEAFVVCVAEICSENGYKSDEVFYFYKNAFRTISNLKLIVEIIGDYGDGRAIPFLRGYVHKNIDKIDITTFNLMRAIIKKLGGEIEDLAYIE